jgi:2,4-dienoyl-CoA reductase-like NADH-dependent reductase (Old Yellow Enzyme family)
MSNVFTPIRIGKVEFKNRFVRSATNAKLANEDGSCTPKLIEANTQLAEGGVGLVITGLAYVQESCKSGQGQLGCCSDAQLPGLTEMSTAVHKAGGKIGMQIAFGGLNSNPELTGVPAAGPSVLQTEDGPVGAEMSLDEIHETVAAFGAASARAKKAGFDAIQLHAAHGYGLSQFLSPFFNKRDDEYGGSLENRARMLLETVGAARQAVGLDFPILVKINTEDRLDGGFSTNDMLDVSAMLQAAGIDAIELSGGTTLALKMKKPGDSFSWLGRKEVVYWEDAAVRFKQKVQLPLMLVGGIRSFETAERLITEGVAECISFCRPLIREPALIKRWEEGDRRPAECISCNGCFTTPSLGCIHID